MKVSQKTEYGLRAMIAIALSAGTKQPVALRSVAQTEEIPEQFLDQIVAKLRKAGFVKSVRGVNGGYLLSRPAKEISVGSLVRALEGSLSPMGCVTEESVTTASSTFCDRARSCHTRNVWLRVMDAVTHALDSISLEDVLHDDVSIPEALEGFGS